MLIIITILLLIILGSISCVYITQKDIEKQIFNLEEKLEKELSEIEWIVKDKNK